MYGPLGQNDELQRCRVSAHSESLAEALTGTCTGSLTRSDSDATTSSYNLLNRGDTTSQLFNILLEATNNIILTLYTNMHPPSLPGRHTVSYGTASLNSRNFTFKFDDLR